MAKTSFSINLQRKGSSKTYVPLLPVMKIENQKRKRQHNSRGT
jgi:hypothetical protein